MPSVMEILVLSCNIWVLVLLSMIKDYPYEKEKLLVKTKTIIRMAGYK